VSQLRDRWRHKSSAVVTQPLQRGRTIGAGATPSTGTIVAMVVHVHLASGLFAAAAAVGLVVAWSQLAALWKHLRRPPGVPARRPAISILKPLCGLDDRLAGNILSFADLPYANYEVLLGLRDGSDPAYPLAWMAARRWPQRFRIVLQQGEPGLNPKVNQLVTLAREARHGILVISDSNTRVQPQYLDDIAAHLEDTSVGLVTHPLVGDGEAESDARLGAIADNLHLTGVITPAVVAAKLFAGKDYVIGKSMAIRRGDLKALGGFESVKNVLAEDFVLGRAVADLLGKKVVLGRSVVKCISVRRALGSFTHRYARWNVMQHQCAGLFAYCGLLLENPTLLATVAAILQPGAPTLALLLGCATSRMATDALASRLLRGRAFQPRALLVGAVKDLLSGAAWVYGLVSHSVEWRSNRLVVLSGSRLRIKQPGAWAKARLARVTAR
jgi:ceramide glucosyltransferase